MRDILDGKTEWGKALLKGEAMREAREALRICYRYNPMNNGSDPNAPKRGLGDIQAMREDAMHLAALVTRLAALSAGFESSAKAADNERKLARSRAWAAIDRKMRAGEYGPGKFTAKDKEHFAESSIEEFYRIETRLQIRGRILNWIRKAAEEMVETLRMLVLTTSKAERKEAALQ